MPPSNIFTIGTLVEVDASKTGYIINREATGTNSDIFTVRYSDGEVQCEIEQHRCRPVNIRRSTTTRSGRIRAAIPLPPPQDMDPPTFENEPPNPPIPPQAPNPPAPAVAQATDNDISISFEDVQEAMLKSEQWEVQIGAGQQENKHELHALIKRGRKLERGWLKNVLPEEMQPKDKIQLTPHAKTFALSLMMMMMGFKGNGGVMGGWRVGLQYAFDVQLHFFRRNFASFVRQNCLTERKERSDKNQTVFEDEAERIQTFTALNTFKKFESREFRHSNHRLCENYLRQKFESLSADEKEMYQVLANRDMERSRFLKEELIEILKKTCGKISYLAIASELGDIVSVNTIRKYIKSQQGFRTRKDRLLPHLDRQAKRRRVEWAQSFWVFWRSCMLVNTQRMQIVLIHMDEKWFYVIRTRTGCKVIPAWGVMPKDSYVHHKSHVGKEMYIVVTAFVLNENDITKGGVSIPIACIRVGKMVEAKKDSYSRVYREDGTYHYPKIAANLKRKKGDLYFKNVELTGCSNGTEKDPKMSLLEQYEETIMPAINEKVIQRYNNGGMRDVCVVLQEDNAGLHNNKTYIAGKKALFDAGGHILFNQPPQSPTTNVHDFTIFPMMSKRCSREQSLTYGSRVMKGEELNKTVMKVWRDESTLPAISRGFAGHHQVVCAILEHEGDNNYLIER